MTSRNTPAPLDYTKRWPLRFWLGATLLFLYAPLLVLMAFSFNESKRNIIWTGFSLKWYQALWTDSALFQAMGNSLMIALCSTLVSVVLGALAAVALWRFRFWGRAIFQGVMALPIVVPEICMGVAMLLFFSKVMPWPTNLVWPLNMGAIMIAHISFSFPFVAVVVRARLASFNREEEEAARDLGASELRAFVDVLVPHLLPALISGGLLAFTLSLDDFVITFFTAGPDTITFPVKIYSMLRTAVTPEINAASTLLILLTVVLTAAGMRLQGKDALGARGHSE